MPDTLTKLPLGGPAWLRAIANDKEEMRNAMGPLDPEDQAEEAREIQGLRDAADRIQRCEEALVKIAEGATKPLTDEHPGALLRCEMEIIAREALAS